MPDAKLAATVRKTTTARPVRPAKRSSISSEAPRRRAQKPAARSPWRPRKPRRLALLASAVVAAVLAGCAVVTRQAAPEQTAMVEPLMRINHSGPSALQAYEFGKRALGHGQFDLALAWFDQALRLDPHSVDAINGKVVALARRGASQAALQLAEMTLQQGLSSPELQHNAQWLREQPPEPDVVAAPAAAATPVPLAAAEPPPGTPLLVQFAQSSEQLRWQHHGPHVIELMREEDRTVAELHEEGLPTLDARFEVSNGAGINGMARRQSAELSASGLDVRRITNHKHFNVARTEVRFRNSDHRPAAQVAASLLPMASDLVQDLGISPRVDVRIVLGRDRSAPSRDMQAARSRPTPLAQAHSADL